MTFLLRPQRLAQATSGTYSSVHGRQQVIVVGGGLAGVSAAVALAERGVSVTLVEKRPELGGRLAAWTEELPSGEKYQMERGFHAFFRQYYNLRALLRRIDPKLSFLTPLTDYPILSADGFRQSFAGLSKQPPFNVLGLVYRTPSLTIEALSKVNAAAALEMLRYHPKKTYDKFDSMSASDYLDSLNFPPAARQTLFDVFAHSFFNPECAMSAGELLMMFHFYFMGNPEGLLFDVCGEPFSDCIWRPFLRYLTDLGVQVRLGTAVRKIESTESAMEWIATLDDGTTVGSEAVVVATPVDALKNLIKNNDALGSREWRRQMEALESASPFAVWRLWLDRPVRPDREPFVGTSGPGILDNISVYNHFQGESRRWAYRFGGSIIELHAYALDREWSQNAIKNQMQEALFVHYPETRNARVVHESFLYENDCPAFNVGKFQDRPTVRTCYPTMVIAGDFVRVDFPTALMERAVTSGLLAANHLLSRWNVCPHDVWMVPPHGVLA